MLLPPRDLTDADVAGVVAGGWGVDVRSVTYLPVGFGSHHWAVVDALGARWFATADDLRAPGHLGEGGPDARHDRLDRALSTARSLRAAGIAAVVAPTPTAEGAVTVRREGHAISLYPHVDGESFGWGPFPSAAVRDAALDVVVEVHTTSTASDLVPPNDLAVPGRADLEALLDRRTTVAGGPYAARLAELLDRHDADLRARLRAHDQAVDAEAALADRRVITHGEPHAGNVMAVLGGVRLVDWDTTALGQPERDLWFLVREDAELAARYARQTGVEVRDDLLDLHREWFALADVAAFAVQLAGAVSEDAETEVAWEALRAEVAGL
ncbi:phosphotransferase family protein [Euzebya sp.]|uniref:phosphotransferase family protein n=1 Tax=Euzebya sp. TaxID=1971409 RepID=UPI00351165F8